MTRLQWLIPLLAIVLGAVTSFIFSSAASRQLAALGNVDSPTLAVSQSLIFDLNGVADSFKNAVAAADKASLGAAADKAAMFRRDVQSLAAVAGRADTASKIQGAFEAYYQACSKVASILLDGKLGDVAEAGQSMQTAHAALSKSLEDLKQQSQAALSANIQSTQGSVQGGAVAGLAGSLLVLLVSFWVSRRAVSSVMADLGGLPADAKAIVQRIAGGDLSTPIPLRTNDTGSLLFAMQAMQRQLAQTIQDVRASVTEVSHSTSDMATGSSQLSQHMLHQVTRLEETTARIEQLTASVHHNAQNAQQANQLAASATSEAESGGKAVSQAVASMSEIHQSARKIVEITSVIDGIAFQTNILALNAAVEAARAGEQGRGFAVVASEVRNLAQRAGSAAKEIKGLIDESVECINTGSQHAHVAGEAMTNLIQSVKRVGGIIAEISGASAGQSHDIQQVNQAIEALGGATRDNAQQVQQTASSAASLKQVAQRLNSGVSTFRLTADAASVPQA